jgi:transcriptional regulator with XRE-family HTH domain
MDLGNTIRNIRKYQGLTQDEFAIACGITQAYLSQIENNLKEPTISVLKTVAEKLNVPLPIIFFQSLTEEDIQPDKKEIYNLISPGVKQLIGEIFTI